MLLQSKLEQWQSYLKGQAFKEDSVIYLKWSVLSNSSNNSLLIKKKLYSIIFEGCHRMFKVYYISSTKV